MSKKIAIIIIAVIAIAIAGAIGRYLAAPLFIDNVVEEAFPVSIPSELI